MNVCRIQINEDQGYGNQGYSKPFGLLTLDGKDQEESFLISWSLDGISDPNTPKGELAIWTSIHSISNSDFNGALYWKDRYWFTYFSPHGRSGGGHIFRPLNLTELSKCKKAFK